MNMLASYRFWKRAALLTLLLCGAPKEVVAQFNYPVGDANGSGWLENRNGLWWLELWIGSQRFLTTETVVPH